MKDLSVNNPSISVTSRTFPRHLERLLNISSTSETCPAIPRLLKHFQNISGASEAYQAILHHLEYHRNTLSNSETSRAFPKISSIPSPLTTSNQYNMHRNRSSSERELAPVIIQSSGLAAPPTHRLSCAMISSSGQENFPSSIAARNLSF